MKNSYYSMIVLAGCTLFAASCAPTPLLNDGMKQEIAAGRVKSMKLYVDSNGNVEKRSLYVTRSAVPDWVVTMANEKIGPGSNEYFELEWYAEAPNMRVYEVTRTIKGKKVEVSMNEHKQLRYIEREISSASLPAKVKAAVNSLSGFKVEEYEEKTGEGFHYYQVEGMQNGAEITYTYDADGMLLKTQRIIPTKLEVTTR